MPDARTIALLTALGAVLLAGACAEQPVSPSTPPDAAADRPELSVRLAAEPDPDSGWNLHLVTEGFRFTPEKAGRAAKPGEGHAHLYLDGEKIARVYGPWHHLDAAAVPKGEHTLTVKLNANDHSPLMNDGEPVEDSTTIASTGESEHEHEHERQAADPSGTSESGDDADVTVAVRIRDGRVEPPVDRVEVERGQTVRLVVRSDARDSVHVHGYDLEQDVRPDAPAVIEFTAATAGLFEVETHDGGLVLTQLAVR